MERITIGLTGDVMIGRLVAEALRKLPATYPWGDLLPLLRSTDLNLINLETALTTSEEAVPKVFNFKCDPVHVQVLKEARIDVSTLANNHILDFNIKGLEETLKTLDNSDILHVGAGKTRTDAKKPVIIERKGIQIGILGYTDNEPSWEATATTPGTSYLEVGDAERVKADIDAIRNDVDLLIVTYHWGPNMRERPLDTFVDFAHHIIDCGADLLHGHSAHIFQGVERYRNKVILYDTGDFIDDYYVDPHLHNDRSFFFVIEASKEGIRNLHLIPTFISNFQVNLAKGKNLTQTVERMQQLSAEFQSDLHFDVSGFFGVPALSLSCARL